MTLTEIGHEFVLAFADDELCVGQNHAWWIAIGPVSYTHLTLPTNREV